MTERALCCPGQPGEEGGCNDSREGKGSRQVGRRQRWSGHAPRLDLAVNELMGSPSESRRHLLGSDSQWLGRGNLTCVMDEPTEAEGHRMIDQVL